MLITLVSVHPSPSPQSIPLANAFLKAYASQSAVSIALVDFFLGDNADTCTKKLAVPLPDAVGFSMYVWNRKFCGEVAARLRHLYPSIKLFCGGPEVTADPASLISAGIFDFVITGEGEEPFLSLCETLSRNGDFSKIPGILLPGVPPLPSPVPVADLDSLPSPYLSGVIDTRTTPGILWQLSRGCTFTCDFCFDSRGAHGVRLFSLERVEAELQHFAATGVNQVFVLDSTFNMNRKRAKTILKMILKYAPDIHFHFEVRSEFIDREMAHLFAQVVCSLQIGLQSADRDVLGLVGRTFDKSDFTAKAGLLNESGAIFGFDLIYGLPGDTLDGFRHSLDYALSLYPNHLDIFPLAVLPGTRLADRGASLDLNWDKEAPYIVRESGSFTAADMAAAARLATACDILYTRGKAVAWFNAIAAVLDLPPSGVLQSFSDWLAGRRITATSESHFDDDDIAVMQQQFMKHLFSTVKLKRYLPLVRDIVTYHSQYAAVLLAPAHTVNVTSAARSGCTRFILAPSARIVQFTYDIDELLECGEPRIRWMYEHLSPSGSSAVIYRVGSSVCTQSLATPYVRLLTHIGDGGIADSALRDTGLSTEEADEFITFAREEGILLEQL